ncbi:MAG: PQQ-binding-like beta-propeller repeat protein [Candidatus Micrarchaeia archaeon]
MLRRIQLIPSIIFFILILCSFSYAGSKWSEPAHFSAPLVGAPVSYSSTIYSISNDGSVYRTNLLYGTSTIIASAYGQTDVPLILGRNVFIFGSNSGKIEAHSLDSANMVWKYPLAKKISGAQDASVVQNESFRLRDLSYSSSIVYAVFDKKLVALSEYSGAEIFSRPLSNGISASAYNDGVFVVDNDKLYSYSNDGVQKWSASSGNIFKSRIFYDDKNKIVFLSSTNGLVMAFDSTNGNLLWNHVVPGWAVSTPVSDGLTVAFGDSSSIVRGLNPRNGKILWETNINAPTWGTAALFENGATSLAIFGTNNNSIIAINLRDGKILFDYEVSGWVQNPSIGSDGRSVLAPASDSSLWAINIWPICTLDYPRTNDIIPPEIQIRARAFSPSGIDNVQLSINGQKLPSMPIDANSQLVYDTDLSGQQNGIISIQCLARDLNGLEESDMLGYKAQPLYSMTAPKVDMSASVYPQPVAPGAEFTLYVKNSQGADISGLLVDYNGKNHSVGSPAKFYAPMSGGTHEIIVRKAGYSQANVSLSVKSDLGFLPLFIVFILLLLSICAYFLLSKKKKKVDFEITS